MVRVLASTPARIATSSYYAFKSRPTSARAIRDVKIVAALRRIHAENYSCYGVRKMWHAINRDGSCGRVARCTVERLMREASLDGVRRKRKKPSTRSADAADCPTDLVDRVFGVLAPNQLWVADITYIPTALGWVYTAFVLDVYSRQIVGWQVTNHLRQSLATDAVTMALAARRRAGESVAGLVHHSDRGVQYRAVHYTDTLADSEVVASVGSRGDSYDNAMAEALNSVYKAELIDRHHWDGLIDVMAATAQWVGWYNSARLHSQIGYRTPDEAHSQLAVMAAAG
ncbi:IS3 family transposase [Corynebacterium atrinae]|uniref:IS3 family transposase n=1 Tax=Corynebacterium atrinae TaxID=1336740 RepID=UPI0025B33D65|nr:IS3 family transposase [Corynebacterium atrinae]